MDRRTDTDNIAAMAAGEDERLPPSDGFTIGPDFSSEMVESHMLAAVRALCRRVMELETRILDLEVLP